MSEKMTTANRRPDLQVSEAAVQRGDYALLLTERQYQSRDNTVFTDVQMIIYKSPRDFTNWLKFGQKWFIAHEIIHDPTLKATPTEDETITPDDGEETPEPAKSIHRGRKPNH